MDKHNQTDTLENSPEVERRKIKTVVVTFLAAMASWAFTISLVFWSNVFQIG